MVRHRRISLQGCARRPCAGQRGSRRQCLPRGINEPRIAGRVRSFSFDALNCEFTHGASMTSTHDSRNFFLEGPAGRLEAILWTPSAAAHPLFGGTMHNKVIYQTAKSLDALAIPVLRFNFRGAGTSAGVHGRGLGELGDVRAALDFLAAEFPGAPRSEEHTSELQSHLNLVCRLLLEKKKKVKSRLNQSKKQQKTTKTNKQ